MILAHASHGRKDENNFNLMRIVAALAVLVTHSFSLVVGSVDAEPLRRFIDMTPGTIAVDAFFATSGFLVTKSLLTRKNIVEFVWARFLRIYPALLVMVIAVGLGVGLAVTTLPASVYLGDAMTRTFIVRTSTLVMGSVYDLPGVFAGNPYPNTVNGSLWTMMYEIRMYFALAALWIVSVVALGARIRFFRASVLVVALGAALLFWFTSLVGHYPADKSHLPLVFFAGAGLYVLKERIALSGALFSALFAAVVACAFFAGRPVFLIVYMLAIPYLVLVAAYFQSKMLFRYNRLGDYSYGVYIFAFPVQQSLVAFFPTISVWEMVVASAAITLVLAVLSWHLIEKRALGLKGVFVNATARACGHAGRGGMAVLQMLRFTGR